GGCLIVRLVFDTYLLFDLEGKYGLFRIGFASWQHDAWKSIMMQSGWCSLCFEAYPSIPFSISRRSLYILYGTICCIHDHSRLIRCQGEHPATCFFFHDDTVLICFRKDKIMIISVADNCILFMKGFDSINYFPPLTKVEWCLADSSFFS